MAADLTQVDLDGMIQAQGAFQTAVDESARSYANMDGQYMALSGSWKGTAAAKYTEAVGSWLGEFKTLLGALENMLSTLSQNTGVYADVHAQTDQQAQAIAAAIEAGGGGLPNFQ
ncbi:WXG100 family type VII secretion target [Streptomyces sp. NPDC048297]|uniref:WXG100 family type VII secretion target n=1 Tax=Streptomyces sp. NPDC048297 TaxID=3365531 RepID=UPI003721BD6B